MRVYKVVIQAARKHYNEIVTRNTEVHVLARNVSGAIIAAKKVAKKRFSEEYAKEPFEEVSVTPVVEVDAICEDLV